MEPGADRLMTLLTGLFNLLSLLYLGRSVMLAVRLGRDWSSIRQDPLTIPKKRLAEQAAFFLGVPPSVLVHELAHALAVIAFGGQVAEFGYRVFWGYVVPQGSFTPAQDWFIAIAGTLGSLAFGAAVWLLSRRGSSRTVRYFGLRIFRFQIYFSLLYYPVFSAILPIGDWRTIYDFRATPVLSALTAVLHAGSLLLFWRADRRGVFEMAAGELSSGSSTGQSLAATAADEAGQLQAIADLQRGGATNQAQRALEAFLAEHPNSAEGHLQESLLSRERGGPIRRETKESAERALNLGLRRADHATLAHRLIAVYYLERGDGQSALAQMDAALALQSAYDPQIDPLTMGELHYLRAQALRRLQQYDAAYGEVEQAIQLAGALKHEAAVGRYMDEKELILFHRGGKAGVH